MERPAYLTTPPRIDPSAFVAPDARVVGDVSIGPHASIWYQAVLRADIHAITIGEGSNIQDGTIIHLSSDQGVEIGPHVTVGHRAIIHACQVESEVLVGMGAIIMDGAVIGTHSIIGAGAVVTQGAVIPSGSLVLGTPAKVIRSLRPEERQSIRRSAEKYRHVARFHRELLENQNGDSSLR